MVTTMTMPRIVRGPTARRNVAGLGGFYYQLAEQVRERCDNSRSNCAICTPVSFLIIKMEVKSLTDYHHTSGKIRLWTSHQTKTQSCLDVFLKVGLDILECH
jgi:hypothetical protein